MIRKDLSVQKSNSINKLRINSIWTVLRYRLIARARTFLPWIRTRYRVVRVPERARIFTAVSALTIEFQFFFQFLCSNLDRDQFFLFSFGRSSRNSLSLSLPLYLCQRHTHPYTLTANQLANCFSITSHFKSQTFSTLQVFFAFFLAKVFFTRKFRSSVVRLNDLAHFCFSQTISWSDWNRKRLKKRFSTAVTLVHLT